MLTKRLIICDVCNTLVSLNSTEVFFEFFKNWLNSRYSFFLRNKVLNLSVSIIDKVFNINLRRKIIIKSFYNVQKDIFSQYFVNKFLEFYFKFIKKNILEMIYFYKNQKFNDIYLVSASIHLPIEWFANRLGIPYFASKLESKIINGNQEIFTGNLVYDLLGQKEIIFKNGLLDISKYNSVIVISDNKDDISLVNFLLKYKKKVVFKIVINNYKDIFFREQTRQFLNSKFLTYEFIY